MHRLPAARTCSCSLHGSAIGAHPQQRSTRRHGAAVKAALAAGDIPPVLQQDAPVFDEPPREPTPEEAAAIAAGAVLTPEQRLARQLQLPITLRVRRQPPGAPTERQLMALIKAAASWQELQAVLYQQHKSFQLTATAAAAPAATTQPRDQQALATPAAPPTPALQQQQQQPSSSSQRPRRRQQPQPLSVLPNLAPPPQQQQQLTLGVPSNTATSSSSSSSAGGGSSITSSSPAASSLNHLHVTEAVRQLTKLLPASPSQLPPAERQQAAALLSFVCQQALQLLQQQHAAEGPVDARALAHIARGLAQLGQRDEQQLLEELQLAALLQVQQFDSQNVAMLLVALAKLRIRPDPRLLQAMQQHIISNVHLFRHQSMANTLWALATLQQLPLPPASPPPPPAATAAAVRLQRELVAACLQQCEPELRQWTARHIAQAAWSLGRLRARPSREWGQALLAAAQQHFWQMQAQDLANLVSALPELRILPSQAWLDAFCDTATIRSKKWQAVTVYSLLFGLAKLRQLQRRPQATTLQQQDAGLAGINRQPSDEQHKQPNAGPDSAEAPSSGAAVAATAQAAGLAAAGRTDMALTAAELSLLCAALLWLERRGAAVSSQQLSGVIVALAELLPDSLLQQLGSAQQQEEEAGVAAQPLGGQQQQQQQQDSAGPSQPGDEQQQQQQQQLLVAALRRMLGSWLDQVKHMEAAVPKKKQARLLKVAWNRLTRRASNTSSSGSSS